MHFFQGICWNYSLISLVALTHHTVAGLVPLNDFFTQVSSKIQLLFLLSFGECYVKNCLVQLYCI